MEHLNLKVFSDKEILPGVLIMSISPLPSCLKFYGGNICDVVTESKLSVGDKVQNWPENKLIVKEVIETRKAKGEWANTSYKKAPFWNKIIYE